MARERLHPGERAVCAYCEKEQLGDEERTVKILKDSDGRIVCDEECQQALADLDEAEEQIEGDRQARLGEELFG